MQLEVLSNLRQLHDSLIFMTSMTQSSTCRDFPEHLGAVHWAAGVTRQVRSILMECTELPPYSDAVRHVCGVPVFDAITACDFYIAAELRKRTLEAMATRVFGGHR